MQIMKYASKSNDSNKLLASLAVFRELYNSEEDIYGVIAAFLKNYIATKNLFQFNLTEITNKLNSEYEFQLPSAVVKSSLGRLKFLKKTKEDYRVDNISEIKYIHLDEKQKQISQNNDAIIDTLLRFIEKEANRSLNAGEVEKITHSFCNFLLDNYTEDEYIKYITAFILENKLTQGFMNQLNTIREGVVIYSGIKYNHNLNDVGSWKTELTIYFDTEIIFHMAGYNGELYKSLVYDLVSLIKEANQKAGKQLVKIKYFEEVKAEIEDFFKKAETIVEGNDRLDYKVAAMVAIINGCKQPSDVVEKKSDLYTLLKNQKIELDSYSDYYKPHNYKYNIEGIELTENGNPKNIKDLNNSLKFLNYISILRRDLYLNNFDNIGYILLTGNSATLQLSKDKSVKEEGQVPQATSLPFITNRFWFKLNKGFGKGHLPKSFDIITKSQISLSKILIDSVSEKYIELQSVYKKGQLSDDQVTGRIIDLRNQIKKPEEIINDVAKDVLSSITEDSIEKYKEEQSFLKHLSEQKDLENESLKEKLSDKLLIEKKFIQAKQDIVNEKKKNKNILESQKSKLDKIARSKFRNFKILISIFVASFYAVLFYSIAKFNWDDMEPILFAFGMLPPVIILIYSIAYEKEFNPLTLLEKQESKYISLTYEKFDYDIDELISVTNELSILEQELDSKKSSPN